MLYPVSSMNIWCLEKLLSFMLVAPSVGYHNRVTHWMCSLVIGRKWFFCECVCVKLCLTKQHKYAFFGGVCLQNDDSVASSVVWGNICPSKLSLKKPDLSELTNCSFKGPIWKSNLAPTNPNSCVCIVVSGVFV